MKSIILCEGSTDGVLLQYFMREVHQWEDVNKQKKFSEVRSLAKVIVVGGGPAGIMAALSAAKNNEVTLIERNKEIGMKLRLTGGGRCNITNNRDIEEFFDKIVNNKKFLYSALYTFSNYSLLEYFSNNGLEYKVELDEKVYTKSDKADEVIDLLRNDLENHFTLDLLFVYLGSQPQET